MSLRRILATLLVGTIFTSYTYSQELRQPKSLIPYGQSIQRIDIGHTESSAAPEYLGGPRNSDVLTQVSPTMPRQEKALQSALPLVEDGRLTVIGELPANSAPRSGLTKMSQAVRKLFDRSDKIAIPQRHEIRRAENSRPVMRY